MTSGQRDRLNQSAHDILENILSQGTEAHAYGVLSGLAAFANYVFGPKEKEPGGETAPTMAPQPARLPGQGNGYL